MREREERLHTRKLCKAKISTILTINKKTNEEMKIEEEEEKREERMGDPYRVHEGQRFLLFAHSRW